VILASTNCRSCGSAFWDGVPGYHYCRLLSIYEYLMVMKGKEVKEKAEMLKR